MVATIDSAGSGACESQKADSVDSARERSQLRQPRSNNVHNKPIAGKICLSSSSLKCSSNFLTYYHNEYDDSNLANDLEIHLDKVSDAEYVESIKCTSHWNLS